MQKIINRLIDESVVDVDKYVNNGSTWLIFTETKQWVIELTKDGTLWYNYNFFKNLFAYMSMDVVENQQYVTKWVEDNVINGSKKVKTSPFVAYLGDDDKIEDTIQNGVKDTKSFPIQNHHTIEDTIQNGVKGTRWIVFPPSARIEETIQNGVKDTLAESIPDSFGINDAIQNGVKHTEGTTASSIIVIEDTIQNGVKQTNKSLQVDGSCVIEDTIQNGIKDTQDGFSLHDYKVDEVIENGVKHIRHGFGNRQTELEDTIDNGVKETHRFGMGNEADIEDAIQNGVKYTHERLDNLRDCVYDVIENGVKEIKHDNNNPKSYHHKWTIGDVIENGVKETKHMKHDRITYHGFFDTKDGTHTPMNTVNDTIQNGIKETKSEVATREWKAGEVINNGVKEISFFETDRDSSVQNVIQNGIKETKPMDEWVNSDSIVEKTIQGGIKETKTPGDDGDLLSTMEWMEENETNSVPKLIDYVVKHGVKETKSVSNNFEDVMFSDKISPHTYADDFTQDHWVQTVVENGIKQTNTWDDDILGVPDRVEVVIKETNPTRFANVEDAIENGVKETISEEHHRLREVVDTLKSGIKEVQPLPAQDGNMDYSNYYYRQGDRTMPHTQYVKDVIENGEKQTLKKST